MRTSYLTTPCVLAIFIIFVSATGVSTLESPDVLVVVLASNEEHLLPTFLGCFEKLDYPKKAIELWIRSDHNRDNTPFLLHTWCEAKRAEYFDISLDIRMLPKEYGETRIHWPVSRYETMIRLKEEALNHARKKGIKFIFYLDTDAFLTNPRVIHDLMLENKTVVAPLLRSVSLYSNFWGDMDVKGYYLRSANYADIVEREVIGTFPVMLVHSAVLVRLEDEISKKLTFVRENLEPHDGIPNDDIITFARSAQMNDIPQFVTNNKEYGYMLRSPESLDLEVQDFVDLQLEVCRKMDPLPESPSLKHLSRARTRDTLDVDHVYLINLNRRHDRLQRMNYCFEKLGIFADRVPAVDGTKITPEMLDSFGIRQLPQFRDPYKKRNLTSGEIGCFLSHYNIWLDIIEKKYDEAIVFEDDIHFETNFRTRWAEALKEVRNQGYLDFVYLGRKRLVNASEPYLQNAQRLVHVDYSYWTLSYYITRQGAQKLVDGKPLSKMVPVDEYIPIMFDKHAQHEWKNSFAPRILRAASVHPLLVYPTHYTGEANYISDTEHSELAETVSLDSPMRPVVSAKDEL